MNRTALTAAALTCALLFTCITAAAQQKRYEPTWESLDSRPIPSWFDDAKFGIFIHWGVYSVPAWGPKNAYSEWYWKDLMNPGSETRKFHNENYGERFKYQDFAPMFKAEMYDPAAWADLFARAGAKYVVLTSKHHDGFCLWPSRYSWNWNSWDIGPHRDLAGELAAAVRDAGLKMGFYYSLYEWFNPFYYAKPDVFQKYTKSAAAADPMRGASPKDIRSYVDNHMLPQMRELITAYKPSVLWTDGEWDHTSDVWRSAEFLAWLFNDSPARDDIVVNDRWGAETRMVHGGVFTSEYGGTGGGRKVSPAHKWEENRGIGRSFGYNRNEDADNYASATELIHLLINTVSLGGNLLLDVGPTADGRIPVIMQQRLLDIGDWLRVNGDAIYGARPWREHSDGDNIRYTARDGALFAIALDWPGPELILTAPSPAPGTTVTLLGHNTPLPWTTRNGAMIITTPGPVAPGAIPGPGTPSTSSANPSPAFLPCQQAYIFKITPVP